jgi:2-polyprenyl-3-methyl-5-hydroxy-6-metoxy-1,4-benzoquinol methylase
VSRGHEAAPPSQEEVIETEISPSALSAMFRNVERTWTLLGEQEPHWSVVTQPEFKADQIENSRQQFYESGKFGVEMLTKAAHRSNVSLPTSGTCFELGCGVGRVTVWLAALFANVVAADISKSHLALATEEIANRGLSNVSTLPLGSLARLESLPSFDCFYSLIVLQHNPPPVMRWILKTILDQMNPGGFGFFQVPVHLPNYRFIAQTYLAELGRHDHMELHALPREALLQVLEQTSCDLVEEQPYDCLGIPDSVSTNFLVRKRRGT